VERREGHLAENGALVVRTGQFTGRSPKDKFLVRNEITEHTVDWGSVNQPMTEAEFDRLYAKVQMFWQGHDVYIQDCFVGADRGLKRLSLRRVGDLQLLPAPSAKAGESADDIGKTSGF